jgi:hypothetical protein
MKLKTTIIYVFLLLSVIGCNAKDIIKYDYVIDIDINTSKEKVWSVITDFKNYSKWNSILRMKNNDDIEISKDFDVLILEKDGSIMDSFKAKAQSKDKYKSFSASQIMLTKGIFKATHYFVIEEISENKVKFIQKWKLEGVLSSLFESMIFDVLDVFKKMNLELKIEMEKN